MDLYTRFVFAWPVSRSSATNVKSPLLALFRRYGCWSTLLTDRAPLFQAACIQQILTKAKVNHVCTSAGHPQANGAVERVVRVLRSLLRKNSCPSTWDVSLPKIIRAYNMTYHSVLKAVAYELFSKEIATTSMD